MAFKGQDENSFKVSLGIHGEDQPWCDVSLNLKDPDSQAIRQSECTHMLPCGQELSVKISKEDVMGQKMFVVDIKVCCDPYTGYKG